MNILVIIMILFTLCIKSYHERVRKLSFFLFTNFTGTYKLDDHNSVCVESISCVSLKELGISNLTTPARWLSPQTLFPSQGNGNSDWPCSFLLFSSLSFFQVFLSPSFLTSLVSIPVTRGMLHTHTHTLTLKYYCAKFGKTKTCIRLLPD